MLTPMRLLKIDDSGNLNFTKLYIGETPPPYAILPHTWGADNQEVSFQDIKNGTGTDKTGYRKLTICSKQALRDSLKHIWADTCCIDKTNHAELTEAINSLFRWYANAKVCYAYLSDVSVPDDEDLGRESWLSEFMQSRWYTRGWILQEHLASSSVEFFSGEGTRLGSKSSLEAHITKRTEIPIPALWGRITGFPIEQRILWQQGRSTKREEDGAYSLLGICGVHLPLIYGEGKANAFRRLRRELPLTEIAPPLALQQINRWMPSYSNQLVRTDKATRAYESYDRISTYQALETVDRLRFRRMNGTMEWLTENGSILGWQSHSSGCLCLLGKMGCGKTIAMTTLVHHLVSEQQQSHGRQTPVLHYFFQHGFVRPSDLFRGLLKQLVRILADRDDDCPKELGDSLDRSFGDENRVPDDDVLDTILIPFCSQLTRIVICIDGVDQCDDEGQRQIQKKLQMISQQTQLKLLLSSQEEIRVTAVPLDAVAFVRLDGDSALAAEGTAGNPIVEDIKFYIQTTLHDLSGPDQLFSDKDLRKQVESELIVKSGCMFLWVRLQMEILAGCDTPAKVTEALDGLPSKLSDLCLCCLMRKKNGKFLCRPKVLKWAAATEEPISIDQVREMLSINPHTGLCDPAHRPSADSVRQSAVGLLAVTGNERLLRPIHHSARTFLFSSSLPADLMHMDAGFDQPVLDEFALSMEQSIIDIARLSLLHIKARTTLFLGKSSSAVVSTPPVHGLIPLGLRKAFGLHRQTPIELHMPSRQHNSQKSEGKGFLQYSMRTWTKHTMEIREHPVSYWEDFREVALRPNLSYPIHPWPAVAGASTSHLRGLLGFAVSHNHKPLLQLLAVRLSENNQVLPREVFDRPLSGNGFLPPLHVAAKAGFAEIVKILLDFCQVNARCPELRRAALHYAACHGNIAIVGIFCNARGAEIDLRDSHGCSPFLLAATEGHANIAKLFLESEKVVADASCSLNLTALHRAAMNGHPVTVKILLDSSRISATAAKFPGMQTALHFAAKSSQQVVEVMVESREFDLNVRDHSGMTPLHIAAKNGCEEVVKIMLKSAKLDVNARDDEGMTPLHIAAKEGCEEVVKVMLQSPQVDVNARDYRAMAPLHVAAKEGREGVAKLLVDSETIDPYMCTEIYIEQTPLSIAIRNEHAGVVQTLLESKDFEFKNDSQRRHALNEAIDRGLDTIIHVLLDSGEIGVHTTRSLGLTALHIAAIHGREDTCEALLSSDTIDINAKDKGGNTALIYAVRRCHEGIVRMLLGSGIVNVNSQDREGNTALTCAVVGDHEGIVKTLLDFEGIDVNTKDMGGETPLMRAVIRSSSSASIVRLLLESGNVDVNSKSTFGHTALVLAVNYSNEGIIRLLLGSGTIDVNCRDRYGNTALMLAVRRSSEGIVRMLLDSEGIDINCKDRCGNTALFLAVTRAQKTSLEYYLILKVSIST